MNIRIILSITTLVSLIVLVISKFLTLRREVKIANKLGRDLRIMTDRNRIKKREVVSRIALVKGIFSDWTLLRFADRYSWNSFVIFCLPKTYFRFKGVFSTKLVIWDLFIPAIIPPKCDYKVVKSICGGRIKIIKTLNSDGEIINKNAIELEELRLGPFTYSEFKNVIIQKLILHENISQDDTEMDYFEDKRRQVLDKRFNIRIGR
jgi:hypothetical protein